VTGVVSERYALDPRVGGEPSDEIGHRLDGELCADHREVEVAPDHQTECGASYTNHLADQSEQVVKPKIKFDGCSLRLQCVLLAPKFVVELCHGCDYAPAPQVHSISRAREQDPGGLDRRAMLSVGPALDLKRVGDNHGLLRGTRQT
jgi:hypothetical protein